MALHFKSLSGLALGFAGGFAGAGSAMLLLHFTWDSTTAAWVQAVGSVSALAGTAWTVHRSAQLTQAQMTDARERDDRNIAAAQARDTHALLPLVESAMALAISALVSLQSSLKEVRTPEGRTKILDEVGLETWFGHFDLHAAPLQAFPHHTLMSGAVSTALPTIYRLLTVFREHAAIAFDAQRRGFDRSDLFDHAGLAVEAITKELDNLTAYRDHLRARLDDERARAGLQSLTWTRLSDLVDAANPGMQPSGPQITRP